MASDMLQDAYREDSDHLRKMIGCCDSDIAVLKQKCDTKILSIRDKITENDNMIDHKTRTLHSHTDDDLKREVKKEIDYIFSGNRCLEDDIQHTIHQYKLKANPIRVHRERYKVQLAETHKNMNSWDHCQHAGQIHRDVVETNPPSAYSSGSTTPHTVPRHMDVLANNPYILR